MLFILFAIAIAFYNKLIKTFRDICINWHYIIFFAVAVVSWQQFCGCIHMKNIKIYDIFQHSKVKPIKKFQLNNNKTKIKKRRRKTIDCNLVNFHIMFIIPCTHLEWVKRFCLVSYPIKYI